jgi:hypothetical protein
MRHLNLSLKSSIALPCFVALCGANLIACGDHDQLGEHASEHTHGAALTRPEWTFCADQGGHCAFSGEHQVRFGHDDQSVTLTASDGIHCGNRAFGVQFGWGNSCQVLLDVEVDEPTMPAVESANQASMDMSGMHDMQDPAMAAIGPFIDKTQIPTGSPGVGDVEIAPTSDQPTPYEIGAFRTSCSYSHMNNDDPIVFPRQPGKAHLHAYFGNTGADASSTAESLRTSGNSTCRGGIANRSAYWVPAVIDKNGAPVKPNSAQVYYKTGYAGIRPEQVQTFPQGLRMIAGDAKATGPGQEHAFWSCYTYAGHPSAVPDCQPGEIVIMMVQFPQCWNGSDLDSADHKSHMAYPVNGACPSSHPVAIPEITFNIYYDVPPGTKSSEWRLASDMYDASLPGGYSAHGDWFEGWDREVAETFVKNCDRASKDCQSHMLGDGRMIFNKLEAQ